MRSRASRSSPASSASGRCRRMPVYIMAWARGAISKALRSHENQHAPSSGAQVLPACGPCLKDRSVGMAPLEHGQHHVRIDHDNHRYGCFRRWSRMASAIFSFVIAPLSQARSVASSISLRRRCISISRSARCAAARSSSASLSISACSNGRSFFGSVSVDVLIAPRVSHLRIGGKCAGGPHPFFPRFPNWCDATPRSMLDRATPNLHSVCP